MPFIPRPVRALYTLQLSALLFSGALLVAAQEEAETTNNSSSLSNDNNATEVLLERQAEHSDAVIFPSFCIVVGAVVYIVSARIKVVSHALPYTAIMFIIGTIMGVGTTLLSSQDNKLHESVQMWTNIDSEVLLMVFLPGLIFKDAVGMNVHLFRVSIWQNLMFAVPMVLAGTTLTALVAFYMFPFNWSFNLCMTFGSILSATDPVAVAALLNELGAPPRLKIHISGEALLNDGAAIVFYSIFVLRYLYEIGVDGVGENVDLGHGVALFFQKSLGGVAVGLFFAFAILFMLKVHDQRFSREESVSEVAAVLGLAYAGYFCSDYVWKTSGVIATLTAGVTVKYLGRAIVNDEKLMEDFWSLLEHILNTVLFTLGGVVYGDTVATADRKLWGYLIVLYLMLTIIRTVLFFGAYPLTRSIGLSTSWQETVFQIHGGLRGAVGIALALSLDSEVSHVTDGGEVDGIYREQTRQVFALMGGMAFLTLVINAPTCKPLLRYLKLSESSQARGKILGAYRAGFRRHALDEMVKLLSQPRFNSVNFAIIESHVPFLKDLTKSQLMEAVERHRETTLTADYKSPRIDRILPYIINDTAATSGTIEEPMSGSVADRSDRNRQRQRRKRQSTSTLLFMMHEEPMEVEEFRFLFLSILRSAYGVQIASGELAERDFLAISLEQSLDLASDHITKGEPLNDWEYVNLIDPALSRFVRKWIANSAICGCVDKFFPGTKARWAQAIKRQKIERVLAFLHAHRYAQEYFRKEFQDADSELSEAGKMVISESEVQFKNAERVLKKEEAAVVEGIVSHKFCSILLNSSINYIGRLVDQGLLKEDEAEHWVDEVEREIVSINKCEDAHGVNDFAEQSPDAELGKAD